MVAGNPAGVEAMFRRYADRLHAYARTVVGDADTADDVVQETFAIAQERARQLRDPERLVSWLYAIARHECLARLRARKRTVMLAESHEPVLDTDPGRALHASQVRELVHAASTGMNEPDREVFELTIRHGLSPADVGRVLGISDKHVHARISRVRDQFEGALGALVLARDGRGRCAVLDGIVQDWDGQLTPLLRKRIDRHVRDCAVCAQRRRERMNPAGLLAAYAGLPFFGVAAALWPRLAGRLDLQASAAAPGAGAVPGGTGGGAGPASPIHGEPATVPIHAGGADPTAPLLMGGTAPTTSIEMGADPTLPLQGGTKPGKGAVLVGAGLAVLLILLGAGAVALWELGPSAAPADEPGALLPGSTQATRTPRPTRPAATATPPAMPPPPFTVTAEGTWLCLVPREFRVDAETSGLFLTEARLYWRQPPGASTQSRAMNVQNNTAWLRVVTLYGDYDLRWWVEATATDGRTFTTTAVTTPHAC